MPRRHAVGMTTIIRADGPHDLTESDARVLGGLGLATVVDLRTPDETEQALYAAL